MILVTGATGNVGRELVEMLLAAGEEVRALTREPDQAKFPAAVELAAGHLGEPATIATAAAGADAAFLLPGYPDMPAVVGALTQSGVSRIVLLTSDAAAGGDMTNAVERGQILSESAVRDSSAQWTILRPSGFMSNTFRWVAQLRSGDTIRAPFADVAVALIDPRDIAAVATVALTEDGHDQQIHRLTGPQSLLPADQVRILGDGLGRVLEFEPQTDAEARADLAQAMSSEYVDAIFRFFAEGTYDDSRVLPFVELLTGRPPGTYSDWVARHAAELR